MNHFADKVVYQIYPKSFYDTNGDGIGDLRGIIEKLDYIKKLGTDYIWITPFFTSPQRDNGYDVANYYEIDPMFGTMDDVEELVKEAEKRQIGIMLDMVFNHTSTESQWFQKALEGDPEYMDYYIFRDGKEDQPPTNWQSKFGGSAWEYVPHLKKWYLHLFDVTQADLNWDNPKVREELKQVIRFWKEKGIQGFRFDVVNLISKPEIFEDDLEGDGRRFYTDGPHVHEYLRELAEDTGITDMITVGEMSSTSLENCIRYSNPDEKELSMVFQFHHLKVDYKNGNKWEIMLPDMKELKRLFKTWQEGMQKYNGWNANFWCNHDQPRAVSRFGDDKNAWEKSAKMLAMCIHFMRGTPYIYQGEEIGMTNAYYQSIQEYRDVESLNYYDIMIAGGKTKEEALKIIGERSRDNGRTPMQWNASEYAGFTTGTPWIFPPDNYEWINVEQEVSDENSIFAFYQKLIQARKDRLVIADGKIAFLYDDMDQIIGYHRYNEKEDMLVLCNFSGENMTVSLPEIFLKKKVFLGNYEKENVIEKSLVLRPYECVAIA